MGRMTRRALLGGTTGLVVLGCGGLGGDDATPDLPAPDGPTLPQRRPNGSVGEPGTLFQVLRKEQLPNVVFGPVPEWLRQAPAIWSAGGGGAAFLPTGQRDGTLGPDQVELARRHGATVLVTGADAFDAPGVRVLSAWDPLILDRADERGAAWQIPPEAPEDEPATGDGPWALCPGHEEVRAYAVEEALRRTRAGASGVWLLGVGRPRTGACAAKDHGHEPLDAKGLDEAVRKLVDEVAAAVTEQDREHAVLCEHPERPQLLHACVGAQLSGAHAISRHWAWRAAGKVVIPVPGWSLDDLHQILAMGHRLALGGDDALATPDGTCEDAVKAARAGTDDAATPEERRRVAEGAFRALHRWRNAALLIGRGMPEVDQATPRPGVRAEAFQTAQALRSLLDEVQQKARELDLALVGAGDLPSLEATLRVLLTARAAFQQAVDDAVVTALDPGHPTVVAYAFDGPGGKGASAVNVGGRDAAVPIHVAEGRWRELVAGGQDTSRGGAIRANLPPHGLRLWVMD